MPYGNTVLPASRQRWHSRPYPGWSWYSIKRPQRDARLKSSTVVCYNIIKLTYLLTYNVTVRKIICIMYKCNQFPVLNRIQHGKGSIAIVCSMLGAVQSFRQLGDLTIRRTSLHMHRCSRTPCRLPSELQRQQRLYIQRPHTCTTLMVNFEFHQQIA